MQTRSRSTNLASDRLVGPYPRCPRRPLLPVPELPKSSRFSLQRTQMCPLGTGYSQSRLFRNHPGLPRPLIGFRHLTHQCPLPVPLPVPVPSPAATSTPRHTTRLRRNEHPSPPAANTRQAFASDILINLFCSWHPSPVKLFFDTTSHRPAHLLTGQKPCQALFRQNPDTILSVTSSLRQLRTEPSPASNPL